MEYVFTTDAFPEAVREVHWRDEFLRVFDSQVRLEHDPTRPFRGRVESRDLGSGTLVRVQLEHLDAEPHVIRHDPGPKARSGVSSLYALTKLAGVSRYHYDGGSMRAAPGDVVLFDGDQSWASESGRGKHQTLVLRLGKTPLLERLGLSSMPAFLALSVEQKLGGLVESYLRSLGRLDARSARLLGSDLIEHFQALLELAFRLKPRDRDDGQLQTYGAQLDNIREYLLQHLGNSDLSPKAVAARFSISTRYLHKLHAARGQSFSEWLLQRRLERCRHELDDPGNQRSITEIALSWGFNDVSHFGRSFQAAYGLTPREWRKYRPVDSEPPSASTPSARPAVVQRAQSDDQSPRQPKVAPLDGWLSPGQASRVTAQFKLLLENSTQFTADFYTQLFETAPDARKLFHIDMKVQGAKLMRSLGILVAEARSPEKLVEPLTRMGLRHADYGVSAEHYAVMGDALMTTLALHLRSDFDADAHSAWLTLYLRASQTMQSGLGGVPVVDS